MRVKARKKNKERVRKFLKKEEIKGASKENRIRMKEGVGAIEEMVGEVEG